METISGFHNKHAFLSNFYPSPVKLDGVTYPSVEHAYQAAKTLDPNERVKIRLATAAKMAKRLGKRLKLRPDWESIKLGTMANLLVQKFQDPDLAALLLETSGSYLEEDNWWGDTFWGVCEGVGQNHLGKLLMEVREGLENAKRLGNTIH